MDIVYEALKKVPGFTDTEAHEVASKLSQPDKDTATKADIKDMATKADIKDMAAKTDIKDMATKVDLEAGLANLKAEIAELETRLVKHQIKLTGFTIIFLGSLMTLLEFFN